MLLRSPIIWITKCQTYSNQREARRTSRQRQRPWLTRPLLTHRSRQPSVVPRRSVRHKPMKTSGPLLFLLLAGAILAADDKPVGDLYVAYLKHLTPIQRD